MYISSGITEGRDFGSSIEILGGINAGEDIVINPPDSITDGGLVRIVQPPSSAKASDAAGRDSAGR